MALSNIFREPRREITESIAGVAVFSIFAIPLWFFAVWFQIDIINRPNPNLGDIVMGRVLGFLFGAVGYGVIFCLLMLTHEIGEGVCNALARRGIELRPKDRC